MVLIAVRPLKKCFFGCVCGRTLKSKFIRLLYHFFAGGGLVMGFVDLDSRKTERQNKKCE